MHEARKGGENREGVNKEVKKNSESRFQTAERTCARVRANSPPRDIIKLWGKDTADRFEFSRALLATTETTEQS